MSTPILCLDLGTKTGWAHRRSSGVFISGTSEFKSGRFEGGGMRFLRFSQWLDQFELVPNGLVYFEEVRAHRGTDAAHIYGGLMATLQQWCDLHSVAYQGVPVGTIKRHATGKGNASKQQVIDAVISLGHSPGDDNEADAIALYRYILSIHST